LSGQLAIQVVGATLLVAPTFFQNEAKIIFTGLPNVLLLQKIVVGTSCCAANFGCAASTVALVSWKIRNDSARISAHNFPTSYIAA